MSTNPPIEHFNIIDVFIPFIYKYTDFVDFRNKK